MAESDGSVIGHIALHSRTSDEVMVLAARATGRTAERLAVVSRLVVSPDVRRKGVGKALLEAAANSAIDRGLRPVLDVATHFHNAIRLYERCGWTRVGEVTIRFDVGEPLDEYVYISPERGAEPGDPT